jgi:hypothetical protein
LSYGCPSQSAVLAYKTVNPIRVMKLFRRGKISNRCYLRVKYTTRSAVYVADGAFIVFDHGITFIIFSTKISSQH